MSLARKLYDLQYLDSEIHSRHGIVSEINALLGNNQAILNAEAELLAVKNHLSDKEKEHRDLEWEVRQHRITYFMTKPFRVKTMKDILDHIETKREREVIPALGETEVCGGTGTVVH